MEKKTELQALKHEEIMLELESIRARRDRLMPICPNCSMQTMAVYQPLQQQQQQQSHQPSHTSSQAQSPQIINSSQQQTPQITQGSYQTTSQHQSNTALQSSSQSQVKIKY